MTKATAEYETQRNDPALGTKHAPRRNAARSAVYAYKERSREEFQALRSIVRAVGRWENAESRGWCQSLHAVIVRGRKRLAAVSCLPQQIIDKIAEETGSKPVQVSVPIRGW